MSQARLLWAYAMLGERMGSACLAAVVGHARAELQRCSVGELTLMLWSLCIAQARYCLGHAKLSKPSWLFRLAVAVPVAWALCASALLKQRRMRYADTHLMRVCLESLKPEGVLFRRNATLICGAASWRLCACVLWSPRILMSLPFRTFSRCKQCTVPQRLHFILCVANCLEPQPVPPEAAAGTALGLAPHQRRSAGSSLSACPVVQAYELLRIDMPAQEAELAAAALPGLLDAARWQWACRDEDNNIVRHHPACTAALPAARAACPCVAGLPVPCRAESCWRAGAHVVLLLHAV